MKAWPKLKKKKKKAGNQYSRSSVKCHSFIYVQPCTSLHTGSSHANQLDGMINGMH